MRARVLVGSCALVLVLLVLLLLHSGRRATSGSPAEREAVALRSRPVELSATEAIATEAGAGAEREPVVAPAPPAALLADGPSEESFPFELGGRILDEDAAPLAGARILLAPQGGELLQWATCDEQGRFRVQLAGRSSTLALTFASDRGSAWSGLWDIELTSGVPFECELCLHPSWSDPITPLHRAPLPAPQALGSVRSPGGDARAAGVFEERAAEVVCPRSNDMIVSYEESLTFAVDADLARIVINRSASSFGVGRGGSFRRGRTLRPSFVEGVVLDELGAPVLGAMVSASPPGSSALYAWTHADEQGRYELGPLGPARVVLRATSHGRTATSELELAALEAESDTPLDGRRAGNRATYSWTARLERRPDFHGRLTNVRDEPLAAWTIELVHAGPDLLWSDAVQSDEEGGFAFTRWPAGALALFVHQRGAPDIPLAVRDAWPGDVGDIMLRDDVLREGELAHAALRVTVLDPYGQPLNDAEVRLWSLASARGAWLAYSEEKNCFRGADLPPGRYRLELGSHYGGQELGPFELVPGGELDLGEVRCAAPALLTLRGAAGVELTLWHVLPDSLRRCWSGTQDSAFALPSGRYRLDARTQSGAQLERELELASGETLGLAAAPAALALQETPTRVHRAKFDRAAAAENYGSSCLLCHE